MTTKYIHIKKPPRNFLQKRKDFSRQGTALSIQAPVKNITYSSSKDMPKLNTSSFQSIFHYLYPHSMRKPIKSERKYFKSVSDIEMSQLKDKIQIQNKKKQQKSLKSILLNHLRSYTQRSQNKSQNQREKSFTKRLLNNTQSNLQQNIMKKNQHIPQCQEKQRKLLESTNFSVRAISCLSNSQQSQNGKVKLTISSVFTKKNQNRSISKPYLYSTYKPYQQLIEQKTQRQDLEDFEPEMDIKLSIKSMSKSEQGEGEAKAQANVENNVSRKGSQKIKECQAQLIKTTNSQRKYKILSTPKTSKYNHLLIRIDKKLLLSANQINNPCLKIERIKSITSRTLTESNHCN